MRKKCLLIGGCGFLLSNFVRKCLYAKDETLEFVTLDKLLYKHSIQNYYANKYHKFHIGDVCDFHQLKSIINLEKPDVVIFGAGDKTINSIQTKLVGLNNLSKLSSQFEKLIYLSSTSVSDYTDTEYYGPNNLQESFEYSAEIFIQDNCEFNYNILRLSDVYGPRQPLTEQIASHIFCALNGLEQVNKHNTLSPLYIDDFCSALMSVIEKGKNKENYSVGYKSAQINIQHIIYLLNNIHLQSNCETLPDINQLIESHSTQSLKDLGWSQQTLLLNGLQETYSWYKNNSWFGRQNEII